MKQLIAFYLLFIGLFASSVSFGQTTSMAGRIVDEHNDPVAGSKIKVYKAGKASEMTADMDGMFYTQLPAGNYFVDIIANGRIIRATKILLQPEGRVKTNFNFKLYSKGVVVSLIPQDRPIAGKLQKN